MDQEWMTARRPIADSLVAAVLKGGTPVLVDLAREVVPDAYAHRGIRTVMAAPLVRRGGRVVALVVGRRTGREAFDHVDLEHLLAYAGYAGSALDVHRARADREKLLLLEEHERIAADLHGQIVQDLFGTGMGLQGLVPEIASREVQRRLLGYVDALDTTIHRIRSTVFEQQERRQSVDGDR
jgi:signal transduction histidine kinase